ncbi:hypothetical protein I5S78_02845 [Pseudomonas putida]|uniref:hypothetical protein n=1 Tax=Pseudomonas putida TaxID=303 RepID=UPI0018D92D1D|nr:hypothetical protein [Pseudomonas putida]MBH3415304.1 hypothetical protein [Pseudomonas putida]
MSNRIGLFTAQTRDREPLNIVAPGVFLGHQVLTGDDVLVTDECDSEAVYIYCKSVVHVSFGGTVTTMSPPIEARGATIAVDRGVVLQIRLMEGEDPNSCWVYAIK